MIQKISKDTLLRRFWNKKLWRGWKKLVRVPWGICKSLERSPKAIVCSSKWSRKAIVCGFKTWEREGEGSSRGEEAEAEAVEHKLVEVWQILTWIYFYQSLRMKRKYSRTLLKILKVCLWSYYSRAWYFKLLTMCWVFSHSDMLILIFCVSIYLFLVSLLLVLIFLSFSSDFSLVYFGLAGSCQLSTLWMLFLWFFWWCAESFFIPLSINLACTCSLLESILPFTSCLHFHLACNVVLSFFQVLHFVTSYIHF